MITLITGATHSGKTNLASALMKKLQCPYYSQDHIKMGLIRSDNTSLTPEDDDELTDYLWPITREIIKTAVENNQSLIIEGCYIPFNWQKDFSYEYLERIRFICIVLSTEYIENHFEDIVIHSCDAEMRTDDGYCTKELLFRENSKYLHGCREYCLPYFEIKDNYKEELEKQIINIFK